MSVRHVFPALRQPMCYLRTSPEGNGPKGRYEETFLKCIEKLFNCSSFSAAFIVSSSVIPLQLSSVVNAATFDFRTEPFGNQTIKSFLESDITLIISDSNSTGVNPNSDQTISSNNLSRGFCAYAVTTFETPRCGYGNKLGGGISRFKLTFDKAVSITSFVVSTFNPILMSVGALSFSLDGANFGSDTTFTSIGFVSLPTSVFAAANQPIFVRTSATIASGNSSGSALIRLSSLTAQEQVPAPSPFLGAAVGFRLSRRIRQRIIAGFHKCNY
jgi:hypothetical protein